MSALPPASDWMSAFGGDERLWDNPPKAFTFLSKEDHRTLLMSQRRSSLEAEHLWVLNERLRHAGSRRRAKMRLVDGTVGFERLAGGELRVMIVAKTGESIAIVLQPDKAATFRSSLMATLQDVKDEQSRVE
jgi:hypothetical protein